MENKPQQQVKTVEDLGKAKALIEAALYASGYPLELKTLCSITRIYSKRKVHELAKNLMEEYNKRGGALEIVELEGQRFVMQLKPAYVGRVKRLSVKPLLTEGPLKTLSYIAYRQPVAQAKVVAIRGQQAYEHIEKLEEMGLIKREKLGKSWILRTTNLFADYFNLSKDLRLMKKQLEAMFSQMEKAKTEKSG